MAALALAALPLSGCGGADAAESPQAMTSPSAATVNDLAGAAAPLAIDTPLAGREWAGGSDGTGIFFVGTHAGSGEPAVIPPGRYEVKLSPGAQDGSWMLCDSALCGPEFPENATVIGRPIGSLSSVVYIGSGSQTLWVGNVILSPAHG
jgi:hypothetical protein